MRRPTPALGLALAASLAAGCGSRIAATAREPDASAGGRPVILLVHGRGLTGQDSAAVREEWRQALEAGARALAGASLLGADDVRLVWYADVLDPRSPEGCEYRPADRRAPAMWQRRAEVQALVGMARLLLAAALDEGTDVSPEQIAALRTASEVLYLGDLWKRCAVEGRLAMALEQAARERRPVILVAYSLGSLVAYSYLRSFEAPAAGPGPVVHRLVTIGSMLGVPPIRELLLGETDASVRPPAVVGSWVNVRDRTDPFAAPLAGVAGVAEVVLDDGGGAATAHNAVRYLRSVPTVRAIVWAWCDAFRRAAAGPAPDGCGGVERDVR